MNTNFSYYEGFNAAQFAEDAYFQQWVVLPLPEDELYWNTYFEIHPHQQETILMARNLVRNGTVAENLEPLDAEEKLTLKQRIMDRIELSAPSIRIERWSNTRLLKIAAFVGGLVLLAATFLTKKQETEAVVFQIVEKTGAGETKKIQLADSSVVILNANSTLTYASNFSETVSREVTLEGNAFFNVRKKADHKSFQVHANGLSVEVLGTEFNVNARHKETEVVLASGKVKLSDDKNKLEPVFMNPGEKVDFDPARRKFTKTAIDIRLYQAWLNGKWNFSSTTLGEITSLMNAYYGVDVVFKDQKIKNLKINGLIPVTDLPAFTNIISKTLDIRIIQNNNQLLIQR